FRAFGHSDPRDSETRRCRSLGYRTGAELTRMGGGPDRGSSQDATGDGGPPVQVLICDDHEVLRHGLRAVLRSVPDFVVVAEAGDAAEALNLATTLRPDVTLVGLGARGSVVHDLVRALTGLGIRVVLLGEAGAGSDTV